MELLHLRVLREVARRGSISAAADALDYTQPAVSRQLAMLERQAGQALVERTPRGARLTSSGEALLRHAEDILTRVDAAHAEMEAIATMRGGRVRVSGFPSTVGSFLPSALRTFGERHPDVQVKFDLVEPSPAQELLRSGQLDVAVTTLGLSPSAPMGIRMHPLVDDPFLCALPPDHPLADLDEVPVAALAGERLIIGSPQTCPDCEVMLMACEAKGFSPNRAYLVDDYGAALGLVAAGLAVAMIPELALHGKRADVVIRPLDSRPVRRIVAMTLDTHDPSAINDAMVGALADAASAYRLVQSAVGPFDRGHHSPQAYTGRMERPLLPSTHDLEAFVAAIEAGSMGGAADALDLTQSAVTKRIARIEAQLGSLLLERGRFGVRPTAAGGALYPEARRALETLRGATDLVRAERAARHETLRITASHTVGEYLLPDWLAAHRRAGGASHATMRIANSPAVLEAVREGEADLGFVEHGGDAPGLETLLVGRDELVVVVAATHRWAGRTTIAVRELSGEPYVTREPASGTRTVAEDALAAVGVTLRPALEAQSLEAVKRSVAGGDGFSLLSPLAVAHEVEAGQLATRPVRGADLRRALRAVRRRPRSGVPGTQGDPARQLWRWLAAEITTAEEGREAGADGAAPEPGAAAASDATAPGQSS